jgi:hypothetical protein
MEVNQVSSALSPTLYKQISAYQSSSLLITSGVLPNPAEEATSGLGSGNALIGAPDFEDLLTKINDLIVQTLGKRGLEGAEAPKAPEIKDISPQETADSIIAGISALLPAFARQNPELEGDELIEAFVAEAKKGIESGYGQAFGDLDKIGAFQVSGVKERVEETKRLLDEGLEAFKNQLLGSSSEESAETASKPQDTNVTYTYSLRLEARMAKTSQSGVDLAA